VVETPEPVVAPPTPDTEVPAPVVVTTPPDVEVPASVVELPASEIQQSQDAPVVQTPTAAAPAPAAAPRIDLAVKKTDSPDPNVLGSRLTYTIVVRNNGPDTAHDVVMTDPLPAQTTFESVVATQGTCGRAGRIVSCRLGTVASGGSVAITIAVQSNATGIVTNTATAVGAEAETNPADNTATATTLVQGPFRPPVASCAALAIRPRSLTARKRELLVLSVLENGKPVRDAKVRVTGRGVDRTSGFTNAAGRVSMSLRPPKAGILLFTPVGRTSCAAARVGVIAAFTPPVTG